MRTHLTLLICFAAQVLSFAATRELVTAEEASHKGLLLVVVRPVYPNVSWWAPVGGIESTIHRPSGSGIFDLRFDYETGQFREVHVVQSTGHPQLDESAIDALKRWKAKPRSIHTLRVPIVFTNKPPDDHSPSNQLAKGQR